MLRYAAADVLLTQGNVPGEACHNCAARLSAYVLRRTGGRLKTAARYADFAEVGTFGGSGTIVPLAIGGDDGLAIEAGGMFQGYSRSTLDLFVFKAGRMVHLTASQPLTMSVSNEGAAVDERDVVEVMGSWSFPAKPGNQLIVDYKIRAHGQSRDERLVWTLEGSRLALTNGRVPAELRQDENGQ